MANWIRTGDPRGFNKGYVGSRVRQTSEWYYQFISLYSSYYTVRLKIWIDTHKQNTVIL